MKITPDDLPKAIPHLAFEFFHFSFYSRHLKDRCSTAVRQAVGYTLLLHFRVLWDFFYEEPRSDDCGVGHFRKFLPEFAAAFPAENGKPAGARGLSKNLNKCLVHMSAERWRKPRPWMDFYIGYFAGIETRIAQFREALPAELQKSLIKEMAIFESRYQDACNQPRSPKEENGGVS